MNKDYQSWHAKKAEIENKESRVYFHEREIWFAHLGTNIGYEQDGKGKNFGRPVIVFRKFNNIVFWAIPLTTKNKVGKFYMSIDIGDGLKRAAILSQVRLIDAKRLYFKIGVIDVIAHKNLEEQIINLCRSM